MDFPLSKRLDQPEVNLEAVSEFILGVQKPNGEIPWSAGGKTDPWDHVDGRIFGSKPHSFRTGAGGRQHGTASPKIGRKTAIWPPTLPSGSTTIS